MLCQLKPKAEFFFSFARDLTRRLATVILCEGKTDTTLLKTLISKAGIEVTKSVGITDCEGVSSLEQVAAYTATLARISRRLKEIVLIVDANEHTPGQRFQSLMNSLRANQVEIEGEEIISEYVYKAIIPNSVLLVKIAGILDLPFRKHMIEDYAVLLLILNGEVKENELTLSSSAKEFLDRYGRDMISIIEESEREKVQQAFSNIIELLKLVVAE